MTPLHRSSRRSRLTQQDKDTGQDGDECPSAEARGQAVCLGVARHDVALVVAAAYTDGERAGTGLLAVRDEDGQVKDGLLLLRPTPTTRQDPSCVVWRKKRSKRIDQNDQF